MIIGRLVSLSSRRLAATLVALIGAFIVSAGAIAETLPDSTWVGLTQLPQQGRSPVFALAVDPADNHLVIAGSSQGSLLRTTDGGSTWTTVHTGRAALTTIVFSPNTAGMVLAGTRGGGALISTDAGAKWSAVSGLDGRDVRVFGFALALVVAGTDNGVYVSIEGSSWKQSGLPNTSIDALAVAAIHAPVRLVAGSDTSTNAAGPPLYESTDGGATWSSIPAPISGTVISRLAAGPLPSTGNVRPLVAGTNSGLFLSRDNGAYVATFRASDHTPALWAYHDTGGSPRGPANATPATSGVRIGRNDQNGLFDFLRPLSSSQTPYIALGVAALLILALAAVSHFRGSRR